MADTRRLRAWLFAGALVVAVAGGWLASRPGGGGDANNGSGLGDPTVSTNAPLEGQLFPEFLLVRASDGEQADPVAGAGPTVVNFWFTTCPPCRREMPMLARAATDTAGQIRFVGINPLDDAQAAMAFHEQFGVPFDTYLDSDGALLADLGVATMPVTLFVDADRRIVASHAGEIDWDTLLGHLADMGVTPQ